MDDGSLNIIPVIFAFSWIFSDKKYGCCFNQLLNFIPVIFAFSWIFVCKKYGQCFIMNIIPVIFACSWIFTEKQWILLQSTSFRSFLLSPEYFLTTNMNGALLNIIPVIFTFSWIFPEKKYGCFFNQLHSGHVCLFLNISWQQIRTMLYKTPFRSFLRSPEYFLTKQELGSISARFFSNQSVRRVIRGPFSFWE